MNFNDGLKRKKLIFMDYDMAGRKKTMKTPKMKENIDNYSNHIIQGSKSMFSRQINAFTL